jgi:hypothetical protein
VVGGAAGNVGLDLQRHLHIGAHQPGQVLHYLFRNLARVAADWRDAPTEP